MKSVDTNLLIRFLTHDSPDQARKAEEIVLAATPGELVVSDAVLAEMCQVLEFNPAYKLTRAIISEALAGLLKLRAFTLSPLAQQASAYYAYNPKLDFVDWQNLRVYPSFKYWLTAPR